MLLTFLYVVLPVLWSAAEVLRRWQAASVILHQLIQLDAVVPVRLKEKTTDNERYSEKSSHSRKIVMACGIKHISVLE